MNINDMLAIASSFQNGGSHLHFSIVEGKPVFQAGHFPSTFASQEFKTWVGEGRLQAISRLPELKLVPAKLDLSKQTIQKIFLGVMALECVYPEKPEELTTLFLGKAPGIDRFHHDYALNAGKFLNGLRERVFLLAHHHYQCKNEQDSERNTIREIEFLTSRLADREIPQGTLVPLKNSHYRVDKVFHRKGAFVLVLRDLNHKYPAKIVCRGTSARPLATEGYSSCLNDLQLQIGAGGIKGVWKHLHDYLIDQKISSVEIYGKSLGGAHAQQLAVLVEGLTTIEVSHLYTFCSVGVGNSINQLFQNNVLQKRNKPFNLTVVRNGGYQSYRETDFIPLVGGVHLGAGIQDPKCNTQLAYIHPGQVAVEPIETDLPLWKKIVQFFKSFSFAHTRQSTLSDFSFKKIENNEMHEHLKAGTILEPIRKIVSYIIHFFTFTLFNGSSFRRFFERNVRAL